MIGNNEYKDFPSLRAAVNDANEISKTLRQHYGFDVELLENAHRADILRSLKGLRQKVGPADNVLIYYAGHGWLIKWRMKDTGCLWMLNVTMTVTGWLQIG